jgi:pyroglutamyl-peptidase
MANKRVLLTGFEPYGGRRFNPSADIARRLDGTDVCGAGIRGIVLPASFSVVGEAIDRALKDVDPIIALGTGLWPGEPVIRLERVATNIVDFDVLDNEGRLPVDQILEPQGPAALYATLPVRTVQRALLNSGIPARLSTDAGTLLCNATLYSFVKFAQQRRTPMSCGFVHVPYTPEQVSELITELQNVRSVQFPQRADLASMDLAMMVEAVRTVLSVTLMSM